MKRKGWYKTRRIDVHEIKARFPKICANVHWLYTICVSEANYDIEDPDYATLEITYQELSAISGLTYEQVRHGVRSLVKIGWLEVDTKRFRNSSGKHYNAGVKITVLDYANKHGYVTDLVTDPRSLVSVYSSTS